MSTKKTYCDKPLAAGQWWNYCGETDMGQTEPVSCTHCGGKLIRAEDVNHPHVMTVLNTYQKDSFELRREKFPGQNHLWFCEVVLG